jgi:predicted small secreted protein
MSVKTRNFTLFSAALVAVLLLAVTLTTCESMLGFGETIDWEPPVLKLDSNRNPRYVFDNAQLKGTVTDNIAIGRVELRYAIPDPDTLIQIKLGEAILSGGNPRSKSWTINLTHETFEEWAELLGYDKIDGAKIPVEIVAFDTSERSGDTSIRAISLIIDLTAPVVENTWITRTLSTPMRISYLESLGDLENLAETDPRGEVNGNADKYQNGWFYIDSQLTEEETRIEEVRLQIYDTKHNAPLFIEGGYVDEDGVTQYRGIERDKKSGTFASPVTAPRWLIKEEALIAAGKAIWGATYETDYYNKGERYYYEVVISALDMSENVGRWKYEDEGFFIMWEKGDVPKGFLDLVVGGTEDDDSDTDKVTRTKGDLLPVEFFDDDSLSWAYTDLFTLDQWKGYKEGGNYTDGPIVYLHPTDTTLRMPNGTDEQKLAWLKQQLDAGKDINNWKNDKDGYGTVNKITELLGTKTPDEKTQFIQTGSKPGDYGDYVLFTLVGDKKLSPHDPAYTGALNTLKDRWTGGKWDIMLVDDNKPMIVFDTVNKFNPDGTIARRGSPEENTFPLLDDGRYFTIHGYTLRQANRTDPTPNKVGTLRMAWIPYTGSPGNQSGLVSSVLEDLASASYSSGVKPSGAQYWELTLTDLNPSANDPSNYEEIGGIWYRKQYFTKTFDLLGGTAANLTTGLTLADYTKGADDVTPDKILKNATSDPSKVNEEQFIYNNKLENETKLFVFLAIDSTRPDNIVDKQLPILGRKTPPKLSVYDISDRVVPSGSELNPPDIYDHVGLSGIIDDTARAAYQTALNTFNALPATFTAMTNIANSGNEPLEEALSLQIYPRGKTLLYWVQAEEAGDLLIKDIVMQDTTYSTAATLGNYVEAAKRLSFVETLPEVTQRAFLFTATDTLGNERQIQRTVTITSTAMLTDMSTPKPNGTYGISSNTNDTIAPDADDRITIYARFSNRIEWEGNGTGNANAPLLNVRYQNPVGTYVIRQIPTITPRSPATLSLEFRFSIPEGAAGTLETMYDSSDMHGTISTPVGDYNRPITLPTGTRIVDVSRTGERVSAFIPGYAFDGNKMETWRTNKNSLQQKKTIQLDGVRPRLVIVNAGVPAQNSHLPVSGKTAFTAGGGDFYFKTNETIIFTLKADKRIQPSGDGNPRIAFYVGDAATGGNQAGPYYANYERANGTDGMIFTFPVTTTSVTRDGIIITNSTNANYNIRLSTTNGNIADIVGNTLASATLPTPIFPTNPATTVYIDRITPPAPSTTLTPQGGTAVTWSGANATINNFNVGVTLSIANYTADNVERWPLTKWYSINGGLTWTQDTGTAITLSNGTHNIVTQYRDRAGNEGATSTKTIVVNAEFPRLLGITSTKPNGTYNMGNSLAFTLDFAENVSIVTTGAANTLSLTLQDRTVTANNADGTAPSYQIILDRTNATPLNTATKTITFTWNSVNGKDMLNGLKVTALSLSGLRDDYGNTGPATGTITPTESAINFALNSPLVPAAYSVPYNLLGIVVSGIGPMVRTWEPQNAQDRTGNITVFNPTITGNPTDVATGSISADNKRIRITFSKPVQRGRGTITVRPHGNYAIPAVFENEGYYLAVAYSNATPPVQTETRTSTKPAGDSTYVSGMNDIYNNMTTAQRNTLITGGTLASPTLNAQTGLSEGPYKKMTHGLKQGAGYTGNYNNTNPTAPAAPGTDGTTFMVPDTATKWVLDYQYQIHSTTQTQVTAIRNALTGAGFRRQEIAVTSTANVAISGSTVTITLSEPLLPGLQWDLFYPEGTFTDLAGNPAAAVADTTHWFWSKGVQTPVIRVDRKSYDARTNVPAPGTTDDAVPQTYVATGYAGSVGSFDTVNYRIETETPRGRIYYRTQLGSGYTTGGAGSITGAWTGRATLTTGTNLNTSANLNWNGSKTNNVTIGEWVRTNLVFRNYNGNSISTPQTGTYTVTENGITVTQVVGGPRNTNGTNPDTGTFGNNYYGFRSFNRDALFSELSGLTLNTSNADNMYTNNFTYDALQASKNYVAADARIDHVNATYTSSNYTSPRGYEGVFRTVIMLNQPAATGNTGNNNPNYILMCGTNVKSGIPTIAGFPVKDGVANADTRYLKVFHMLDGDGDNNRREYYWVSTEMVTSWYMQSYRRGNAGGSYLRVGDATDWMTAGYGDLSYAYNVYSW